MTQEFQVSVTPVGSDDYLVRTERVAPGVPLAEEQITWPVADWLSQARQLMSNPIVGLLQDDRPLPGEAGAGAIEPTPSLSLVELGQHLYSALFYGTLRDSWVIAQGVAQHRNEALRLRLGLKGSQLQQLPWEVLYSNDTPTDRATRGHLGPASRPLATGTHIVFSRYQPNIRAVERLVTPLEAGQPLRVLMVVSAPTDREQLALQTEARRLQQELRAPIASAAETAPSPLDIQLTILEHPGRERLTQALEQGHFQVLHYAGHSDLGEGGGNLYLVNSQTGLTETLSGGDLTGLLVNNGIRLAVFNSCRGSYPAAADPLNARERSLAEALVSCGIPAVLAMAEQIPDNVALTLTWLFYRNLRLGYPIDLSLSRARQGLISAYGSHQLYWALPTLYLHPEFDGYLTPGNHTQDNPADRLILVPQGYSAFPVLAMEETVPLVTPLGTGLTIAPAGVGTMAAAVKENLHPEAEVAEDLAEFDRDDDDSRDEEWVARAVMAEEESEIWDDEMPDLEEGDEEDSSMVAELIRQLSPADSRSIAEDATDSGWIEDDQAVPAEFLDPATASLLPPDVIPPLPSLPVLPPATSPIDRSPSDRMLPAAPHPAASRPRPPIRPTVPPAPPAPVQPAAVASQGSAAPTPASRRAPAPTGRSPRRRWVPIAGVLASALLVSVGIWSYSQYENGTFQLPGSDTAALSNGQDLQTLDADRLATVATERLRQGQLAEGAEAVGLLLDRGAFQEASEAMKAVPAGVDAPEINFLWGRLAWQGMETDNPIYTLKDAERYWEQAVQADPDNPKYREALGFAYYIQGDYKRALDTWQISAFAARDLAAQPVATDSAAAITAAEKQLVNTYAGMALAVWRLSAEVPPEAREAPLSKAIKLYRKVEVLDPGGFQLQVLRENWLWKEGAIQDWQALSQLQP